MLAWVFSKIVLVVSSKEQDYEKSPVDKSSKDESKL
jgi:hypothetical protein